MTEISKFFNNGATLVKNQFHNNALTSTGEMLTGGLEEYSKLSLCQKVARVSLRVFGSLIFVVGVAAAITLPIGLIAAGVAALSANPPAAAIAAKVSLILGKYLIFVTEAVIDVAKAGGDIGGFAALIVGGVGYGILLVPLAVAVLPGALVAKAGASMIEHSKEIKPKID